MRGKLIQNPNSLKPNLGKRFLAGLLDYSIIYSGCFLYISIFGKPNSEGEMSVSGILAFIPTIWWGCMTIGVEQWFGATLGNLVVGLKPVSIESYSHKLSLGQSSKRHLLDPIDMFLFGFIAIVTIKNTRQHQRLGDIWAHTVVIKSVDYEINSG